MRPVKKNSKKVWMKNETHRSSTKISMNFKNKTHGTSETNKSINHCDSEWGFKIKHTTAKKFNKNESEVALKNYGWT